MVMTKNRLASNAGFAVHRSFAPTRIERELLAQVFEIVHHRTTLGNADAIHSNSTPHEPPDCVIRHYFGDPLLNPPLVAREAAA